MRPIKIHQFTCLRCNHVWKPENPNPVVCPSCKNPYWNKPRQIVVSKNNGTPKPKVDLDGLITDLVASCSSKERVHDELDDKIADYTKGL